MLFDRLIAVLNSSTINYTHNANNELTVAGAVSYSYDQNGNTIQETNGTQVTKYTYNSSNRLERVELPDGRIVTYTYDSFGRRTKKDINGQVTYYLYADEGLIGEYDSAGNNIKSYGWIPDSIWGTNPVFMLENDQYYFYHNNHLGTPEKITDINGTVVWSAEYTAYGEAIVNEDPDGDGIKFVNNLRLPGQYYDEETKKHYNFNRYYDPGTGRYIQSDPVKLLGGVNLYRYALNNPARLVDQDGLNPGPINPGNGPFGQVNVTSGNWLLDNTVLGVFNTAANTVNFFVNALLDNPVMEFLGSDPVVAWSASTPPYPLWPDDAVVAIAVSINKLNKAARVAKTTCDVGRKANEVIRKHHAWAKYLGGAEKQDLIPLSKKLHDAYHSGLDKILPRQKGSAYYENLTGEALTQTYRDLANYTKAFDAKYGTKLFDAMIKEGFPIP